MRRLLAVTALGLVAFAARAFDATSPVGTWRSLDDKTGRTRALIHVYDDGGRIFGRIEWTDDPADAKNTCTRCRDDRKDAPILGLVIIRGLVRDGDGWDGGDILDPRDGKVYRCRLRLEDEGRVLVVRGYVGVSALGGSRRWVRDG